jgi:hypothetical protein
LFENGAAVDGARRRAGEVDMSGFDVAILIGIVALVIWVVAITGRDGWKSFDE